MRHVLFLCTGNSCRSILAEAVFNHMTPQNWRAVSAGSYPAGYVHPGTIAVLQRHHIDTKGLSSKSWDELETSPDIVITVCASAAGETCPTYLGKVLRGHWGLNDPAKATGSEEEVIAVFEETFSLLDKGITFFLQHSINELSDEELQHLIDITGQRFFKL